MKFLYAIEEDTLAIRSAERITSRSQGLFFKLLCEASMTHKGEVSGVWAPYVPMDEGYQLTKPVYHQSTQPARYVYFSDKTDKTQTHEIVVMKRKPNAKITMQNLQEFIQGLADQTSNTTLESTKTETFNYSVFDINNNTPACEAKLQSCNPFQPQYDQHKTRCRQGQVIPFHKPVPAVVAGGVIGFRFN